MKCVICEDSKGDLERLSGAIQRYAQEKSLSIEVSEYSTSPQYRKDIDREADVIFLDVEMEGYSGIDLAKIIRSIHDNQIIVFVSNHEKYAIEAFQVRAFHYLKKPLNYEALSTAMDLVLKEVETKQEQDYYIAKSNGSIVQYCLQDILYFEKQRNRLNIVMKNREVQVYGTVKEVIRQVERKGFVQVNQGVIVNLKHVHMMKEKMIYLNRGDCLSISKHRWSDVKKTYFQYLREGVPCI